MAGNGHENPTKWKVLELVDEVGHYTHTKVLQYDGNRLNKKKLGREEAVLKTDAAIGKINDVAVRMLHSSVRRRFTATKPGFCTSTVTPRETPRNSQSNGGCNVSKYGEDRSACSGEVTIFH